MILPAEIWTKIFLYLDRFTIREIASFVCKEWLKMIRNDSKLSSELVVNQKRKFSLKALEINSLLLSHPKLKKIQIFGSKHLLDSMNRRMVNKPSVAFAQISPKPVTLDKSFVPSTIFP